MGSSDNNVLGVYAISLANSLPIEQKYSHLSHMLLIRASLTIYISTSNSDSGF